MADYYKLLGVPRDASPEAIQRAYRAHAKRLHPDLVGTDRGMAQLGRIYATLRDPAARLAYDARLAGPPPAPRPERPTRVFHPPVRRSAVADRFVHATLLPLDRLLAVALRRLDAALAIAEARPGASLAAQDLAKARMQAAALLAATGPRLAGAPWPAELAAVRDAYVGALRGLSDALVELEADVAAGRRAFDAAAGALGRARTAALL